MKIKFYEGHQIHIEGVAIIEVREGDIGWYLDIQQCDPDEALYIGIKDKDGTHYMYWQDVNRRMQQCNTTYDDVDKYYDEIEVEE